MRRTSDRRRSPTSLLPLAVMIGMAMAFGTAPARAELVTALVPAYFYPGTGGTQGYTDGWDQLNAAAGKIPLQAIVNPGSGPGNGDSNYTTVVNNLAAAGGQPIGYIYTNYGNRGLDAVEAEVKQWLTLYPKIQGIFLDGFATDASLVSSYYQPLYQFIKDLGKQMLGIDLSVVANPGTTPSEEYLKTPTADKFVTFEGSLASFNSYKPADWMANYNPSLFGNIVYDVPTAGDMQQVLNQAVANGTGSVYITDQPYAPPTGYLYDRMPSYWNEEVAAIAAINAVPEPSTFVIAAAGGLGMLFLARRRHRA